MRTNTDQIAQFLEHTCSMHTIHVYKYRSNSTFGKLIYCTLTRLQHWSWRREDGDFSFCSLRNWETISIVSKDSVTSACPVLLSNTCNVEVYHHRRRQYCIYSGEKMFLLLFCFFFSFETSPSLPLLKIILIIWFQHLPTRLSGK